MSQLQEVLSQKLLPERIQRMLTEKPRMVIAIDGRGGSGKSSLAREICQLIPGATHVEYDWFHLPKAEIKDADNRFDSRRLLEEVIRPFRAGQQSFELKRYNWGYLSGSRDGLAEEPVQLNGVEVLVLEGCGLLAPVLSDHVDLRVWVDTSAQESLARGMRRDIEEYGLNPERVRSAWLEWALWEDTALSRDDRRLRADVIV